MGTSTSHSSPKTTQWKAVGLGYIHDDIPLERILSGIWRASESVINTMGSDVMFKCQEALRNSPDIGSAIKNVSGTLAENNQNSIVAELAKRAVPVSFKSDNKTAAWRSTFLGEVMNYLVSRDVSGYVGGGFRNKSINDLIKFKGTINNKAREIASRIKTEPDTAPKWKKYLKEIEREILKE